jgi:dolichol-phosphate mannosyltransferase
MTSCCLSVIVPCYNEEESLPELYRRVSNVCHNCVGDSYELVLINDGSKDNTWRTMCKLTETDKHVLAVDLSRNYGHQIALSAGLQICRGERVLILDADLQDPPEVLPEMMARMESGFDVVYGQRIKRDGENIFKKSSAFAFYRLLNSLAEINIPQDTGDFRLMSRRAVDILNRMPEQHRFIRGMVSWIGMRQDALLYERSARFAGKTKYPLSKMIRFALDAITGFSIRPLRIASYLGFCFGIATMILMIYVFIQYYRGFNIEGWTSLAIIILSLGTVQLFVAGIMGEYLGRLYIQSKERPIFLIQEVVCSGRFDDNNSNSKVSAS